MHAGVAKKKTPGPVINVNQGLIELSLWVVNRHLQVSIYNDQSSSMIINLDHNDA